jgi:hypothetical protein
MNFLKKFLGKIGKSGLGKKIENSRPPGVDEFGYNWMPPDHMLKNYGKTFSGRKAPKNMQKLLPEGDFKTFKDHPFASKDATKKYDDVKNGAKRAARNEKIWKAVKYGLPASLALGTVTQTLRSAESATRLQDVYRKKLEEEEDSKKRIWQR